MTSFADRRCVYLQICIQRHMLIVLVKTYHFLSGAIPGEVLGSHSLSIGKKILVSASSKHSTAAPPRKMIQVMYHAWVVKLMIK